MSFSIYLHIPFCRRLCSFCHFYRMPEIPDWGLYLDAVSRELDFIDPGIDGHLRTVYVGGGTPTLLPPDFYLGFFKMLGNRFDLSRLEEATIETDGEVDRTSLDYLSGAGFNRVSVGIKSFSSRTRDLLQVGGLPRPDLIADARAGGFSSVSLDIIYGVKGQSVPDFVSDVEKTVSAGPDHISLYALEERSNTGVRAGDPDTSAHMFRESMRILLNKGFEHYEITNFARPGHRSIHNMVYWHDGDYFGLGPSAHSSATVNDVRVRWRNRPDIRAYLDDPEKCRQELSREEGADRAREALILGLRVREGVERVPFTARYGFDPVDLLAPHTAYLVQWGLLKSSSKRIRLTTRGMLLSNEVFVRIL